MNSIRLDISTARKIAGTRSRADFLINALACTQSKTAKSRDGWFYKSYRDWATGEVSISRYIVTASTEYLVNLGIVTVFQEKDKRIFGGIRTWYRVNVDELQKHINKHTSSLQRAKNKVKSTIDHVVDFGKKLVSKPEKQPKPEFKPSDFDTQHAFIYQFTRWAEAKKSIKTKLWSQFTAFGFASNYVKKCLKSFIKSFGKRINNYCHDFDHKNNTPEDQRHKPYTKADLQAAIDVKAA